MINELLLSVCKRLSYCLNSSNQTGRDVMSDADEKKPYLPPTITTIRIEKPCLLPPITAVQIVWALTGLFSKEKPTQDSAPSSNKDKNPGNTNIDKDKKENKKAEEDKRATASKEMQLQFPTPLIAKSLEDIRSRAKCDQENLYLDRVMAAMDATLRTLNTIYKGRNLNFDENNELRTAYLESMKESIDYGSRLKDILTGLPTTSVGAAGGVTFAESLLRDSENAISNVNAIAPVSNSASSAPPIQYWLIVLGFAALGFLAGWVFVWLRGRRTQRLFVRRDYERKLYFCLYLWRVHAVFASLYDDVCRIYKDVFGEPYPEEKDKQEKETIYKILEPMWPNLCDCVPRHMINGKIKPELWPLCETGNPKMIREHCKVWKKEKRNIEKMKRVTVKDEEICRDEWPSLKTFIQELVESTSTGESHPENMTEGKSNSSHIL